MKKFIYSIFASFMVLAMASCSEEEFEGANGQLPLAEDIDVTITVDQTTNQVTFTLNNKGVYPIWKVYKTADKPNVSTRTQYTEIVPIAGTYDVEVQIGSKNGICQGSKMFQFTIENTIVDWSPYVKFLTNNGTKRWEMARTEKGHLGCGESGTDGTNWWSAGPDEKVGTGMYEAIMEFTAGTAPDGTYKLDGSNGGKVYCNTGVTVSPYGESNTNDGNDYPADIAMPESSYSLVMEGNDLFLEFPTGTVIPYLAHDDLYNTPRYKVLSMTTKKLELVADIPGVIAWHYLFVPEGTSAGADQGGDEPTTSVQWVDPNSADNLMNSGTLALREFYWATGADWAAVSHPEIEIAGRSAVITTTADAGSTQWQAQVHLNTGVAIEADKAYDFKVIINPSVDITGATVKPHPEGDDENFFGADRFDLGMAEDNVVTYENVSMAVATSNLVLTFDFAGTPAGTTINIKEVIIQEHREGASSGSKVWADAASADNLMNGGTLALSSFYWANNDWAQVTDPEIEIPNSHSATITVVESAGTTQWQAQVHLSTGVAVEADKAYDFKVVINPTADITGATVKPHPDGDDGNFFGADRFDLASYEDNEIIYDNVSMSVAATNLVITFDFAGAPAGTVIEIKEIILQEHTESPATGGGGEDTPSSSWVDSDSADNLFNSGSFELASFWWADDNWAQVADPEIEFTGARSAVITPTVNSGYTRWQGQVHLNTNTAIEEGKTYDFKIVINPTADIAGATVKPHPDGDDAHFFSEATHDLSSYEDNVITYENFLADFSTTNLVITLDFPGTPAGAQINIVDIVLQEDR